MHTLLISFLLLFLPVLTVSNPKNKTFKNVLVLRALEANSLYLLNNAIINGNLQVYGKINGFGSVNLQGNSTVDAVARFANTSGELKDSSVLVDDAGNITINGITKSGNTVSWPSNVGAAGSFLGSDGAGNLVYATPVGSGNVSTATPFAINNAILTTDAPSGVDNIKQSNVILDAGNNITGVNSLTAHLVINAPSFIGDLTGDVTGDVTGDLTGDVTGDVTGDLNGNAATATSALTAGSATNFSGPLSGDVTGIQNATVVSFVGGQTATNIAAGATLANAATSNNTASTLVRRDGSGNFNAGNITANLTGNVVGNLTGNASTATSATTAGSATNFSGSLAGDVTGTQSATVVSLVGGQTAANVASATIAANAATNTNTANTIVQRDGSGNFSAGTITANLTGNVTGNLTGNATTATTATTATNFSGSLVGDVTGTQGATVVSLVGGQTAANVASATIAANAATSNNTAGTIVRRDGSGNFNAGNITANLTGNVVGNATTATTATNFTGSLVGDVTGTQGATVVSLVGGQTAANVASATVAANAATSTNTVSTIVKRDGSGNFSAGTITANLSGNATTATTATSATTAGTATNFSGSLVGDVTGTQSATVVSLVDGQTAANIASATIAANAATNTNTANTIVQRDGSGNFSAGTITANLTGNVTGNLSGNATTATTAGSATNFSGSLVGDVTGTQGTTVVSLVDGQTAANVASATIAANAATNLNTASTIVERDGSGNFSAGTITANLTGNVAGNLTGNVTGNLSGNATTATTAGSATNFSGSLAGDVTGTQGTTVVSLVGGQTAANVASATIAANAATNNNMPNTIVERDASGNFITNMITIDGTVTNPTDVATKSYVDTAVSTGLAVKQPAVVVSTINVALSGLQTIDGVTLVATNRVLLVAQTSAVQNGLWVALSGSWTRPTDFDTGTTAGEAYVLILSGTVNAGSSWVCSTPTAVIDTDPIEFAEFSLPSQTTGANVGTGAGQIFRDKTGVTLNFKTIAAGTHVVVTNDANDVTLATDATNSNTPSTIVARDGSGNFSADNVTASLTGSASLNVLKAGDTMTGNLNLALQSQIRFQDSTGSGNYVGLNAPATVGTSYTVNLPASAPTAGQVLQASSPTATLWATVGGLPTVAKTYYVALNGSDSNDGSFGTPFRTVSHAVNVANGVASLSNPVVISVGAGIFVENNSGGAIAITADGISIVGSSISGTVIQPSLLSNNLFSSTTANLELLNFTLAVSTPGSTASALVVSTNTGQALFHSININGFQTGFALSATSGSPVIIFENIIMTDNNTAIAINNIETIIRNSVFIGSSGNTPANIGVTITGVNTTVTLLSNDFRTLATALSFTGGSLGRITGQNFDNTLNSLVCAGGCDVSLAGCIFIDNSPGSINIAVSGANTDVLLEGCNFHCLDDDTDTNQGTAIQITTGASISLESCSIEDAVIGIQCGAPGDTNTTFLSASGTILEDCLTDIIQAGSSTLQFFGGVVNSALISINDPTNVSFAAFNNTAELIIGTGADVEHTVYEILNGQTDGPELTYEPNYYGNKGTVYTNSDPSQIFNGTQAQSNNAYYYVVTGDRTKEAGINLISDSGNFGVSDNVRGWSMTKTATAANLAFSYSNNDTSGQAALAPYIVMQLDGVNNQVEFPMATSVPLPTNTVAKLVWAGDTDLYRASAGVLATDGNLIVGGLNSTGVVHTDNTGLLSTSLIVNADISASAAITDNKLATISTAGKVANSATTATSTNTPNTIVARDGSGNFSADNVTASLTGSASLNVLRAGDTMTGNLNLALQSQLRLQDSTGSGNYVGLDAPTTVGTSYTVNLPSSAPTSGQVLQASSPTATQWATVGGSPAVAKTYYVALNGSDSNDGSFSTPFRTVSHAVSVANGVASLSNPVVISIGAGIFVENNSGGPISITANAMSIVGSSITGTIIQPSTLSNDLFNSTTANLELFSFTLNGGVGSTANGLTLATSSAGRGGFHSIRIAQFQTGFALSSSAAQAPIIVLEDILSTGNGTSISINNLQTIIESSLFIGPAAGTTPTNTAIAIAGTNALTVLLSNTLRLMNTGVTITGGASTRIMNNNIGSTNNGVVCNGGSFAAVISCNFILNNSSSINIAASGANTEVAVQGCSFQCADATNTQQGTAIQATTGASILADSSSIADAVIAIQCGTTGDTSSTTVGANSVSIDGSIIDIQQVGTSTMRFTGGVFDTNKLNIANAANVSFAAFDAFTNNALSIGNDTDSNQTLYQIINGQPILPSLLYQSNYYGNKGTVYTNQNTDPIFNGTQGNNNTYHFLVTGDRTKEAGINLISDSGNFGVSDNVRGWSMTKTATAANLAFTYSNNDTSGQAARGFNTVMQLNGFDNQLEFPTATNTPLPTNTVAKLVWAGDTDLYRSAAGVLTTDGNLVVGGLTANRAVATNASSQLVANVTTDTELGFLSGTTSSVQTQLNGKVSKAGDTMIGSLQLPAGTTSLPSLNFTGSSTTGLSANGDNLSLSTAGSERVKISSLGIVSIDGFTSAGVVHNDASGNLSSSLIVNADISSSAAITDNKLATISTTGKVANSATTATSINTASAIVARDVLGNFSAGTITANLTGNVTGNLTGNADTATNATTAINFTGSLVGDVTGTQGATVVSSVGGQTASSVAAGTILANAATNSNTPNTVVKRDTSGNFSAGTITANLTGNVTGNLTGNASTATTAGTATNFSGSLAGDVTGTQGATVVSLVGGQTAANVASATTAANAATNTNTVSTIVKRDASGNFSAGTITANLTGNATTATTATSATTATTATNFSGSLAGDVTGTQSATVVSLVGGQTAANVASATVTANAATSTNTVSTIVKRDASGNFGAGTITANLTGNVTGNLSGNATTATNAGTATNFSGSLVGDVTGIQGATVVSLVGGQTAANVASATVAANAATNTNTASTIVKRDALGNFATNMVTLNGTTTNPTDAATKSYVDTAVSTGIVAKQSAVVVSTSNIVLLGLQTIDGVALVANNRVLLVGQTLAIQNGLWLAQVGAWTRPTDFATGTAAGSAYVLITSGTVNAGSSWLCNTPAAIIGTNTITFAEFSLPSQTTGANVGTGAGQIFRDTTGVTLNFKTIAAGLHVVVTNDANDVMIATDATNANTPSTIVARDASGNFSAGTITANLVGNATTSTTTTTAVSFSGSLLGDVTGTQSATVVSLVGGQTATNIASGVVLANAATNNNTASTIVRRDASGNFTAGTITANLTGNATTATSATTATTATNFSGSLAGDVTGTQGATVVSLVGGQMAANVASATTAANAATNTNTVSTIVKRDASGNFTAGTITANLTGNATTATSATTATTATNFSGSLAGDVTGTQGATVVSLVGGQTAANVASATTSTNAATSTNTASTIVKRDASGNFSASTITANLNGNATTATTATNFSGSLAGDVTGTQGATVVSLVGGQTAASVATATTAANAATSTNTASTIVRRDVSGNFSAGAITANLIGNATTATAAGTATNFSGSLAGDVTGTQGATVVSLVGGQTAASVATATVAANAATNLNTVSTIVKRDASGNFSAGTITANLTGNATTATTATSATTATTATNFSGSLAGDVTGTQGATVVSLVGGQTAANVASATVAANAATSTNTVSTIVKRDASGNFSAGTITANLTGNVTGNLTGNASTATTATTATNFSGSLAGDVTGTQSATVVSSVGGQTAASVASGVVLANAATNNNTASTIVRRDASGNFAAGTITANLAGNASTATTATNFSGSLAGDVTGTQGATVVSLVGGQTAANVASATTAANAATNLNTVSTIVKRDASGNFSAGTITANLTGNATTATTATSATTATTATNFSGSLAGDVTGTQSATVVSLVGGQTAANVASATVTANAATSTNTVSTIVKRDASGNFAAGTITANLTGNVTGNLTGNASTATTATTATNFSGSLAGDVTGTQSATVVSSVGGQTAANVASGVVLANAATNNNTASTIVRRDASGNFTAGTIIASIIGAASLNVLKAGDTMTGTLILPAGTAAVPSLQFTGSTDSGISAATVNTLSFDTSGVERMRISTDIITVAPLIKTNVTCDEAVQSVTPVAAGSVTVNSGVSILILKNTANITNFTINFPPSPTDGQLFTILCGTTNSLTTITNTGGTGAAAIVNPITTLAPGTNPTNNMGGASVTYFYSATVNTWYRFSRG